MTESAKESRSGAGESQRGVDERRPSGVGDLSAKCRPLPPPPPLSPDCRVCGGESAHDDMQVKLIYMCSSVCAHSLRIHQYVLMSLVSSATTTTLLGVTALLLYSTAPLLLLYVASPTRTSLRVHVEGGSIRVLQGGRVLQVRIRVLQVP